jgi:hypothetical protein
MGFLRRLGRLPVCLPALMANSASLLSQFVERHANRGSIEPPAGPISLHGSGIPPDLPEDIDGDFLRAGRIANDTDDYAGDTFVMNVKETFKIESVVDGGGDDCFAWRVHVISTTATAIL